MAYTKQTWQNGDVITAEKLNHMEDGIASGGTLVIGCTNNDGNIVLDKTWQEINNFYLNGGSAVIIFPYDETDTYIMSVIRVYIDNNNSYRVIGLTASYNNTTTVFVFQADSASGYPSYS